MAPALTAAYDELIGPGRWDRCSGRGRRRGAVPGEDRANASFHVEGSYAGPGGDQLGQHPVAGARAAGAVPVHRRRPRRRADPADSRVAPVVPRFLAPYGEAGTDPTVSSGGRRCSAARRSRDRRGRGRVPLPPVHRAHRDLAAPRHRAADDRPAGLTRRTASRWTGRPFARGRPSSRPGAGTGKLELTRGPSGAYPATQISCHRHPNRTCDIRRSERKATPD